MKTVCKPYEAGKAFRKKLHQVVRRRKDGKVALRQIKFASSRLTAENGIVTTRGLADNRGITTRTASGVLKGLAARGVLAWCGKSLHDPKQYYEITPKEIS